MKRCPRCGHSFPPNAYHFYRNARRADGLQIWCIDCQREHMRELKREQAADSARIAAYYRMVA